MIDLKTETPDDYFEVENLYDLTFAPGRSALSSYQLRDGVEPVVGLCFVARDDQGVLAGAIRQWPVVIGKTDYPALLVGPIAVHPTRQGEGLGALMVEHAMTQAGAADWRLAVLIGDEPYYGRFGFRRVHDHGIEFPPPTNAHRILARELAPGALSGVEGQVRRWPEDSA